MSRRIRIRVAYDGTDYHGWQLQQNASSIEGELNRVLGELFGEDIQVIGASRTDAGVHAFGNVAVFDTEARIPAEKVALAMNTKLPDDIRVMHSEEVAPDWHPRKQDCRKSYEYRISTGEIEVPTCRRYSYFTYRKVDAEAMRRAAAYLIGEHDFAAFCAAGSQAESTVRTIYSIEIKEVSGDCDSVVIRVTGNGFLYNMVRILAGTLLEVGTGRRSPDEMEAMLASCDRRQAGPTLPARGLVLIGYEYKEEL